MHMNATGFLEQWSKTVPTFFLRFARVLLAVAMTVSCTKLASSEQLNSGWWVVVASFPEPDERSAHAYDWVKAAAASCGVRTFNDFSAKFLGFQPGYNVFVVGAFASRRRADGVKNSIEKCFPGAYVKYGKYLGE
jgi:hypothetical protein